jgi:hypothetical protein
MDDPNLDLQECGVSDPKEAQRAWLERFRDRIDAVPRAFPALRTRSAVACFSALLDVNATSSRNARACAARGRLWSPTQ